MLAASLTLLLLAAALSGISAHTPPDVSSSASSPSPVLELTATNFDAHVTNGSKWLVMFYAPWCPLCKRATPVLARAAAQLSEAHTGRSSAAIGAVDATQQMALSARFLVYEFPKFMVATWVRRVR